MATEAEATLDAAQRTYLRLCGLVTLEAMVCFAVPAIFLLMGTIYSPILVASAFGTLGDWRPLTQFVLGCAGAVGVARLLRLLWNRPMVDRRPWLTLASVGCGCGASLLQATNPGPGSSLLPLILILYVPVACAVHLVALNRRALFP